MSKKQTVKIGRVTLQVSNLDKVLYPETGFTKGQVIDYYARIAPVMLPHLKGRPLSLKRYPDGVDKQFFFQKNCPTPRPDWVHDVEVGRKSKSDSIHLCVIDDLPGLVWLANLASIELHTYLSKSSDFNRPTTMVFDLDPGPGMNLIDCLDIGLRLRKALQTIGLESFPKTSGSKGLHVAVPLNGKSVTYEQTKTLARSLAGALEAHDRAHITTNMRKSEREGKVFVDWSQNDQHKTTVCAYSLRARTHPNVAAPLSWDEVQRAFKRGDTTSLVFEADDMQPRIKKLGDLYGPVEKLRQKVPRISTASLTAPNGQRQRPAKSTRGTTRSASPASSK